MIAILKEHITTVVGRYRGQIEAWDVVNEAIGSDGKLRDSIWLETIGPDYIDMAFEWAHKADPKAKLFYNDYSNEGKNTKSDAIFKMVKGMVERGVPINGVGLQMHIDLLDPPNWKDVADNMQRLSDFGFEVHITEMDVRIQQPVTENQLTKQANIYYNAMQTCLNATNCKAFVMWGFTDLYSWIPGSFPGYGSALIFDEFFNPKPAYDALMQVLGGG
jgi:endo-1,4-beta-xylanase